MLIMSSGLNRCTMSARAFLTEFIPMDENSNSINAIPFDEDKVNMTELNIVDYKIYNMN